MRTDMAKVIVERPRLGTRQKMRKGYRKQWRKLAPEDWPKRERISEHKGKTKWFNEHLGPLRRYLCKQAGRPWDKVFSEICENIRLDSVVQNHLRGHVFDFVAIDVIEINGVLCHASGWFRGRPLTTSRWALLYVCPKTGILRRIKSKQRNATVNRICESATKQYHRVNGKWYEVTLRKVPTDYFGCWDALLNKPVFRCRPGELTSCYGYRAYAMSKRQLAESEARKLVKGQTKA